MLKIKGVVFLREIWKPCINILKFQLILYPGYRPPLGPANEVLLRIIVALRFANNSYRSVNDPTFGLMHGEAS